MQKKKRLTRSGREFARLQVRLGVPAVMKKLKVANGDQCQNTKSRTGQ